MPGFESKTDAKKMVSDVHKSLKEWATENGYTLNIPGRTTYTLEDGLLQFKVEVRQDDGKSNGQVQWERRFLYHDEVFVKECYSPERTHSGRCALLEPGDWNETLTLKTGGSDEYRIVGHNDAKKKFKVVIENTETGKRVTTSEHTVALGLGREATDLESRKVIYMNRDKLGV